MDCESAISGDLHSFQAVFFTGGRVAAFLWELGEREKRDEWMGEFLYGERVVDRVQVEHMGFSNCNISR